MSNIYYVKIGDHNWVKSYAGRHTSMFSVKIVPDQLVVTDDLDEAMIFHHLDPAKRVAEAFGGSEKMMKKYNITDDGFGDTYTFRFDNNCLPLKCGWWIVDCGKLTVLGYTFGNWKTMSDEDFRRMYKEVKHE